MQQKGSLNRYRFGIVMALLRTAFHLDRVPRNVVGAFLLAHASKKPLKLLKSGSGIDIALPRRAPDAITTVLVLDTK
jgi:hypothetical protein